MDSLLIRDWLGEAEPLPILDAASVALARQEVRRQAALLCLPEVVSGSLVNIASELGHNQLAHARGGQIVIRPVHRGETAGLEIVAADAGGGIVSPRSALLGAPRSTDTSDPAHKTSLGIGLCAVQELADETDFDIRLGEGSCVWARKFAEAVPRRRQIGIYGRPLPGEAISGDHAGFVRTADGLLAGVADGLGHGSFAREAANVAIESLWTQRELSLPEALSAAHEALKHTRGAVMAAARVSDAGSALETAGVGNVSVRLYGPQLSRRFSGPSCVLGAPGPTRKPSLETHALGPRDVLVMFTDGLTTRFDLDGELDLLREHPIIIAQSLIERFAREHDDALALVVR